MTTILPSQTEKPIGHLHSNRNIVDKELYSDLQRIVVPACDIEEDPASLPPGQGGGLQEGGEGGKEGLHPGGENWGGREGEREGGRQVGRERGK